MAKSLAAVAHRAGLAAGHRLYEEVVSPAAEKNSIHSEAAWFGYDRAH